MLDYLYVLRNLVHIWWIPSFSELIKYTALISLIILGNLRLSLQQWRKCQFCLSNNWVNLFWFWRSWGRGRRGKINKSDKSSSAFFVGAVSVVTLSLFQLLFKVKNWFLKQELRSIALKRESSVLSSVLKWRTSLLHHLIYLLFNVTIS